ncbi:MAG: dienelactone hydrolase family protein [Phycisphaerales bacterium]|nr:dienelactone hydrolase family protein [Phycisphaerales bacterium]
MNIPHHRFIAIATLALGVLACLALVQQPTANIPPDAEAAPKRLLDSPRHGEWVEIPLASQDAEQSAASTQTKIKTWVVYPERKEKAPIVIVIHEIFGLTDWVRAVADQLAADGFIAVAPDLLSGKGPNGGGTESFEGDKVKDAIMKLPSPEVAQRLNAVRDHALKLPAAAPHSASIGFCWGGSQSFNYAAAQPGLKAAVVYYGTAPMKDNKPDTAALAKIKCPVLGLYGSDDARVNATVEPTAQILKDLNKTFIQHSYDGAGHGFLRQQNDPQRGTANLDASKKAWAETIKFLNQNLE